MTERPKNPQDETDVDKQEQIPTQSKAGEGTKLSMSGLAIAGLVLGLIAFLSCWIPLFNALTTPLAVIGLILAIIGIVTATPQKGKTGRGLAIAGCALSAASIAIFFAMYGLAAVGASMTDSDSDSSSNTAISAPAGDNTDASDESSDSADESDTPASDNEGIVIKSCKASRDYAGKKTAVVTLEWTNETDKTSQFFTTYNDTAYVKGEEAQRTFGSGDGWYNDQKKIKKGKTQTIKFMYDWDGKSDIEFEVTKLFASDPIVSKTLKVK